MPHIIKAPYPDTIPVTVTAQPSGTQATYTPNTVPFDKGILQNGFHIAEPQTAWTSGQYARLGNGDHCRWQGTSWKSVGNGYSPDRLGGAPEVLPFSLEDIRARNCTAYGTWQVSDKFTPQDGIACYWNGAQWVKGYSPEPANLVLNYLYHEGTWQAAYDYSQAGTHQAWLGETGDVGLDDPQWDPAGGLEFRDWEADRTVATSPDALWTGSITFMLLLFIYGRQPANHHCLITKGDGSGLNCVFDLHTGNADPPVVWAARGNASGYRHHGGPALPQNTWFVLTYVSGGTMQVNPLWYINYTSSAGYNLGPTVVTGAPTGNNGVLRVGRRADGVCQLHGKIGLIWGYNVGLNTTQVLNNYQAIRSIAAMRGITLPT